MFGLERLCSLTILTWDSTLDGASEIGEGRFDSFPQYCPTLAWAWMPAHSITWSLILMTTSQLKSTTKVTKLPSEATETKTFSPIWKIKEGMQAVLVEQAEPITIRKADGKRRQVKDQYILLKWSEKLSLILEIPETDKQDPAALVAEINSAEFINTEFWGKYFPMAKERLF